MNDKYNLNKKYINHDERLGATDFVFSLHDMVEQYKICGWNEYSDENNISNKMSDDEIVIDILNHDIEEV